VRELKLKEFSKTIDLRLLMVEKSGLQKLIINEYLVGTIDPGYSIGEI